MSYAHSPTFPSLHLRHNSFPNPSVALPTSQCILQPFRCFTYVTVHSPTLLSLLLRHKHFTNFTWRAAHAPNLPSRSLLLKIKRSLCYGSHISSHCTVKYIGHIACLYLDMLASRHIYYVMNYYYVTPL